MGFILIFIILGVIAIIYVFSGDDQNTIKQIKEEDLYYNNENFYKGRNLSDSSFLKSSLIKERGPYCEECGNDGKLIVHHILPVSMGGKDSFDNLMLLCHHCHLNKHNHNFSEMGTNYERKISKKADDITRAIKTGSILSIKYQKPNFDIIEHKKLASTTTNRDIKPLRYYIEDGKYYLEAFCYLRNEKRIFKVSRIMNYTFKE